MIQTTILQVKVDETGKTVRVTEDGLVKIDGITAFRIVERNGIFYMQFCDHDRMRSSCRGTRYVEVPIEVLTQTVTGSTVDK